mgnify:CR=1 FL=1
MSCHVAKSDSDEKFTANFIPHDAGRHRLDVKFNGDKVPGSPWFCEVRNHLIFDLQVSHLNFDKKKLREKTQWTKEIIG